MQKGLPLSGIKVVELGTYVAVPNTTRWLADWGADVVKIESISGDDWRTIGRAYNTPITDEENPIFTVQNANKNFLALDVKKDEGKSILFELIKNCDIFVSNVRLNSLKKMGVDYESAKAINEKIIFVHFTGFGYEGQDKDRPGFDMAAYWARSGALVDWADKGGFPAKPTGGFGDATVSAALCSGILCALYAREKNGKGTFITSSLLNAAIWYNTTGVVAAQEAYGADYPKSSLLPANPIAHIYQCKDGEWLIITAPNYDSQHKKMFDLLGLSYLNEDDRFKDLKTLKSSPDNTKELVLALNEAFKTKEREEWCKIFDKADVVYEKLVHMSDVSKDPQAWDNGYLKNVTFESGNTRVLPTVPIHFSEYDTNERYKTSGKVGRDSQEILKNLGYDSATIESLISANVIK